MTRPWTRPPRPAAAIVDHDVHGLAGVRLLDPSPADAAMVARQIGAPRGALSRDPDIVIRFVDDLGIRNLRWVEMHRTGYADDGFYVVPQGRRASRARLAFGADGCPEIVCQRGGGRVPFLVALVALAALRRGAVPLHASAFLYGGAGVLVTGWAKGGKTEALLAFAARGGEYIGDEWILLSGGGRRMHGLPEHIRLHDWHLGHLPGAARAVPASTRAFFKGVRGLERLHRGLAGRAGRLAPVKLLGAAMPALLRQLNVQLDPVRVFGRGASGFACAFDKLCFMVSADRPGVSVRPADPGVLAARAAASLRCELLPLRAAALAHEFAFPGGGTVWLDEAEACASEALARAFDGKEAYVVEHPYPVDLGELFEAMAPVCVPRSPSAVIFESARPVALGHGHAGRAVR